MRRIIFILLGLLLSFQFAKADPVKDLIKNAGCANDYPNQDLLVVFDSTHADVQESGLSYANMHRLYKVLTPKGALDVNAIEFGYDPLSAYVDIKKIVIHRKDGSTEVVDTSRVKDYPAPARMIYWGAREKMLEVGRLEPGDAVEVFLFRKGFTYALLQQDDERYIPPMRGHYYDIVEFWSSDPVKEKVYEVRIPKEKFLQYQFYHGEVQSKVRVDGDEHMIYSFSKKDITPFDREPRMVATSNVAPKLLLTTSPDWEAKSRWFYGVNEDYGSFEWTPEIKAKVDELLEDADTEMDSVSILTHWVADNIRYSGLSMGEGEGYTLHKGKTIFRDRCGVCKDKAGMLITMLRAAGFESYAAMTMAGSRIEDIPADQFNHSVTLVRLSDGKLHLLDPTWVPFLRELWSSAEQQQNYLPGPPEGHDLAKTPISPPKDHYFRITGESEIEKDGTLKGSLTLTAEGQSDAAIRRMFTSGFRQQWEKNLKVQLLRVAPKAAIKKMDYGNPYEYMEGPIEITMKYSIPDYATITDDELIFTPLVAKKLFSRGMSHLYFSTNMKERKYAFRDRCSRLVELKETIELPGYGHIVYQPENGKGEGSGADYEVSYRLNGDELIMEQNLSFKKRVYKPEDWPSFREAVARQKEFAENPIILKK